MSYISAKPVLYIFRYFLHIPLYTSNSRGDSSLQLGELGQVVLYTWPFTHSHKKTSKRGKSREQAGQGIGPPIPIHESGSFSSNNFRTFKQ